MRTPSPGPEALARHLADLKTPDCTCNHGWRSLGRLYGVSFGHGWVRLDTNPACPYHGGRS
jgi:hypothetical protein